MHNTHYKLILLFSCTLVDITKCHKPGDLQSGKIYFTLFWALGHFKVKMLAVSMSYILYGKIMFHVFGASFEGYKSHSDLMSH